MQFGLPPWSVSILPDCKSAIFNTVKVIVCKMVPMNGGTFSWQSYAEATAFVVKRNHLQLMGVNMEASEGFPKSGQLPILTFEPAGHCLDVFINGTACGNLENPKSTFSDKVNLRARTNKVAVEGEALSVYTFEGSSSWYKVKKPLTWYKATFDSPQGNDPLALDIHEHHGERWYEIPWSWLYPKGSLLVVLEEWGQKNNVN
ncbi:Beta-galactosidase [Theobroma cacao]|nr:Beta-galactosidase [Theobroma cacao]